MAGKATSAEFARETTGTHAVDPAPQLQVCSAQRGVPSRKPITTRMASSSRCGPHEETGSACSQSPLCGDATAISRARSRIFEKNFRCIRDRSPVPASLKVSHLRQWLHRGVPVSPNLHNVCNPGVIFHSSELQYFGLKIRKPKGQRVPARRRYGSRVLHRSRGGLTVSS